MAFALAFNLSAQQADFKKTTHMASGVSSVYYRVVSVQTVVNGYTAQFSADSLVKVGYTQAGDINNYRNYMYLDLDKNLIKTNASASNNDGYVCSEIGFARRTYGTDNDRIISFVLSDSTISMLGLTDCTDFEF